MNEARKRKINITKTFKLSFRDMFMSKGLKIHKATVHRAHALEHYYHSRSNDLSPSRNRIFSQSNKIFNTSSTHHLSRELTTSETKLFEEFSSPRGRIHHF
jgi:hypothetical protein